MFAGDRERWTNRFCQLVRHLSQNHETRLWHRLRQTRRSRESAEKSQNLTERQKWNCLHLGRNDARLQAPAPPQVFRPHRMQVKLPMAGIPSPSRHCKLHVFMGCNVTSSYVSRRRRSWWSTHTGSQASTKEPQNVKILIFECSACFMGACNRFRDGNCLNTWMCFRLVTIQSNDGFVTSEFPTCRKKNGQHVFPSTQAAEWQYFLMIQRAFMQGSVSNPVRQTKNIESV